MATSARVANWPKRYALSATPWKKGKSKGKQEAAKTFQEIASNPARTEMSLRVFLSSDHRKMPRLILTDLEIDNVIAYILSLR